ncbi:MULTISPECIES: hypothetical protein [unclassified Thioalkalivibrio]|uniref:hypothetical protein n=1 Tax=unclassified Thioalkalivibrio TaxID=2621013 RepID=UPI00035DC3CF|nr:MULTISPECIES: hypothetical protein [unclassified Thioalkalivibrio]
MEPIAKVQGRQSKAVSTHVSLPEDVLRRLRYAGGGKLSQGIVKLDRLAQDRARTIDMDVALQSAHALLQKALRDSSGNLPGVGPKEVSVSVVNAKAVLDLVELALLPNE